MLANAFIRQALAPKLAKRVLPTIGRIKIGIKTPYTTRDNKTILIPKKLDHFIITKNIKDESGNFIVDKELMKAVAKATGQDVNHITMIPIIFPYIKPDLNLQTWLRSFENGKPYCRGNGEIAERWEEGKSFTVACPCERYELPDNDSRKCKIYARLNVIIRDAKQFGGVWVFHTTGQRSVLSLISQMSYFSEQLQGYLSHYVFLLMLNQERVVTPEGNISTIYYVNIVYDPDFDTIENTPLHKFITKSIQLQALPEIKERIKQEEKMLEWMPATILAEEETNIEDIQKEFFPDEEVRQIISEITEKSDEEELTENETITEQETPQAIQEEPVQIKPQKTSYSKPQEALQQGKTETIIEESERTINDSQMSVIKNIFKHDLSEKALAKLHTLTFRQGATILTLLQQRKKEEALNLLQEWLENQSKDQGDKNLDREPTPLAEEPKAEKPTAKGKEEPVLNTAKVTQPLQQTQEKIQKDAKKEPSGSLNSVALDIEELKKLDDKSLINLLRQHQVDIKELFNDESVLPDLELDI